MPNDVSIDLGSAVPYLVESIKGWFGKDSLSTEARKTFENVFRLSCEISSHVQCVGMSKPIPIENIYQKTELSDSPYHDYNNVDINQLITKGISSIIFAGPGDGKTTLQAVVDRHVSFGEMKPEAGHLLRDVFLRGEIPRGEIPNIVGMPERSARRAVSNLLEKNYLVSDSEKGPVMLGFPASMVGYYFPRLYPEGIEAGLD